MPSHDDLQAMSDEEREHHPYPSSRKSPSKMKALRYQEQILEQLDSEQPLTFNQISRKILLPQKDFGQEFLSVESRPILDDVRRMVERGDLIRYSADDRDLQWIYATRDYVYSHFEPGAE
jgi:hypothetical protein